MPSCRCLILTAATAIVGCSSPSSDTRADASTDRAAIVTAMNAYLTAVKSSDASAIASRWTDDAFYIDRKSPTLRGSAGIDSMLKAALAQVSLVDARLEADDIAVSGDIGYYLGHIDETLQPKQGPAQHDRGRLLFISKRQADGIWTLSRGMSTDLPAS